MIIGVVRFGLHLPGAGSLKDKRRILLSLKDRIKNKFNVSVAELEDNELWQKSVIGVAVISNDKKHANAVLTKTTNLVESHPEIVVSEIQMEWL
ncbi:MAG: DUF503 domain-containing protein [candidate division Zixibacteria bacterium]|nr:DUF503 domain-containing protein [candidate division Zixibacteria bacterium]